MASRCAKRKLPLKTRVENYILKISCPDRFMAEVQAEIRAERKHKKAAKKHPKTGECRSKTKTGICDGCEKTVPWNELEVTRTGLKIAMCLCKECRK